MRIAILSLAVAALVAGCGSSNNLTSADADSGVASEDDAPDDAPENADSSSTEGDAAPAGEPCTRASDCPTYDCASCGAMASYCKGTHVCATEEETCAAITCEPADAG